MSIVCTHCGERLPDGSTFCHKCGKRLTVINTNKPKGRRSDSDEPVIESPTVKRSEPVIERPVVATERNNAVAKNELWTWLKKDSKRKQYFTENVSTMTERMFMQSVNEKMRLNGVPATIKTKEVEWDIALDKENIFYIHPDTTVSNPLTCMVQFNHVGKFTYVEEKVFITPPDLPAVPEKSVEIDPSLKGKGMFIIWGILALVAAFITYSASNSYSSYGYYSSSPETSPITALLAIIGLALCIIGGISIHNRQEIEQHNRKCKLQLEMWNKAWSDWEDTIFLYSFQEASNGRLSRIFDAAYECIKQVADQEFTGVKSTEQDESMKMNELEEMIGRRREEYL